MIYTDIKIWGSTDDRENDDIDKDDDDYVLP